MRKKRYRKKIPKELDFILIIFIVGITGIVIQYKDEILLYGTIFIITIFLSWLIYIFYKKRKSNRVKNSYINDDNLLYYFRGMPPTEFEIEVSRIFSRLGYQTKHKGKTHDGGIDVEALKNNELYLIQCKKYITSTAGVKDVREFFGVISSHLAKKGFFISTNGFTPEAIKEFENNPRIELVDQFKLIDYYKASKNNIE